MHFVHPAVMAVLFGLGLLVAGRGGAARMVRLRETAEAQTLRRHRRPAAALAALVVAGYAGGLLTVYLLLPFALTLSLHFVMGTILLGLLALVVLNALLAHRGVRWALHAHPLLATAFLLLYLVQAMLGLQLLGYAPLPPEPSASSEPLQARSAPASVGGTGALREGAGPVGVAERALVASRCLSADLAAPLARSSATGEGGFEPGEALAGPEKTTEREGAACPADATPPLAVNPEPDESARFKPLYALCPQAEALPTPFWTVEI
jgi:hypothetical protein